MSANPFIEGLCLLELGTHLKEETKGYAGVEGVVAYH